ncbi:MAG TPA: hypothetical protein VFQ13_17705, partial [Anaerolineales bacterium]|nr:hypothetical protein [Anaerolineales bacterium]
MDQRTEIEQLKEQEDVKAALKQTTGTKEAAVKRALELNDKLWFGTYIFALLVLLALYSLLGSDLVPAEVQYISILRNLLLDTTLWEFGGPYLSTQHPSGRIIKFPNSLVLNETVYNYSWPLFPYIW